MICIAMMIAILIGISPAISQEEFEKSGEIDTDARLESSEELLRLKLQTDDSEDPDQIKTLHNSEEYDVGKILGHLQITQRPRPVIDLRPVGGHVVIHKQDNKHNGNNHASHHDEYIPVKITSDTEYVIKPQHSSHNQHHSGGTVAKPEIPDTIYHIPEYSYHGGNNYGYNNHGYLDNEYNHRHNDYVSNNHYHNNHGNNDHEYSSHKYPHVHHDGKPAHHYSHVYKPLSHESYSTRPHIESHSHDGHYSKPHESFHGDYKPHESIHGYYKPYESFHGNQKPHGSDLTYYKPHENFHGDYKPHSSHGEHNIHHDHKPYYYDDKHADKGEIHHEYDGKPSGFNSHHDNHRPFHIGHESHSNSHHAHDPNKPYHGNNNYEVYEYEHDNHQHKPLNHHSDHKPHRQHNKYNSHNQHSSSHNPTSYIPKPHGLTHDPQHIYNHKPSKPINSHTYHEFPHKYEPHNHHHHHNKHHGNTWKPNMSSVNNHKTNEHKHKPKNYQQEKQNEEIKSQIELSVNKERNETVIDSEKLESGTNPHKHTSHGSHMKQEPHTIKNKPLIGSVQSNKNRTHMGSITSPNSHRDKIVVNTSPSHPGGNNGGHIMGSMLVTEHKYTHKPSDSHNQNLSKPSSHKNHTSSMEAETHSGNGNNNLKPHTMTSNENPKPIIVQSSNRPVISSVHESETQSSYNRPVQELVHTEPSHKPHYINYNNFEHSNNNYYEITEPDFETQLSSNEEYASMEESTNGVEPILFKPNIEEIHEDLEGNSQEHMVSSYGHNQNKPHHHIHQESGSYNDQFDHQFNNPFYHDDQQNSFHGSHNYNSMKNEEDSSAISGGTQHKPYYQDIDHQNQYDQGNHNFNPYEQQYIKKPVYHPSYHGVHHYDHPDSGKPNKCSSSHDQYDEHFHSQYYDQQHSHSNHHNYYGKPVNDHHTHQVSKPFNIDHGSPFGVSGIFINNFKKRPNSWYVGDGSDLEILKDNQHKDRRESRNDHTENIFENNMQNEKEESYLNKPGMFESNIENFLQSSRNNIPNNPHSRRHRYAGFDSHEEDLISKSLIEKFHGGMPLNSEYDLEEEQNNRLYEAEKALAYVINPSLYTHTYTSRPHTAHHGLQQIIHQNFLQDPNHHQYSIYNQIKPHLEHQSNYHQGYGIQVPYHHQSQGLVTTHTINHKPYLHNTGQDNSHTNNHAHIEIPNNHHSHSSPVKYVYIPVLYNFQPHIQDNISHMSAHNTNFDTINLNHKLNKSKADHSDRLTLSELSTGIREQEYSAVVKPTLDIFKAPTPALPIKLPEKQRESLPLLWQLLGNPQLMYLDSFANNVGLDSRDINEYSRQAEPLEKKELKLGNGKVPTTSNWHETQDLHVGYASKCKDIWDSILLAQQAGAGIEKQAELLSRSNNEETTRLEELEGAVESLVNGRSGSNSLGQGSSQDLKDSLESTCIEVLKNALLSQLEILDIKRRETINSMKNQSQSVDKFEGHKENFSSTVSKSEASESGPGDLEIDEHNKDDLPIAFENLEDGLLNVREDEQKATVSIQDYHW